MSDDRTFSSKNMLPWEAPQNLKCAKPVVGFIDENEMGMTM